MLEIQKIRYHLGEPVRVCMACARELKSPEEKTYGLCKCHQESLLRSPEKITRHYGRGKEYQLLEHSDALDDIIYKLEFNEDIELGSIYIADNKHPAEYLIYAHYIAGIFLSSLEKYIDLSEFDYITFADSNHVNMEIIFTEMGYLSKDKKVSELFLTDPIYDQFSDGNEITGVQNKTILLLDLYRGIRTRRCIDRLRLSGAGEVTTVYLTSYS